MNSVTSIALSGLGAASLRLDAAANNIANGLTPDYRREQVAASADAGGGVSASIVQADAAGGNLAQDMVDQMVAAYVYEANLGVIRTQRAMMGTLLDIQG